MNKEKFLSMEYDALRSEIEMNIASVRRTDEICLVGWSGSLAWLFTSEISVSYAFLLPSILALGLYVRRRSFQASIEIFHKYIMTQVEEPIGIRGWEHFIHKKTDPINRWANYYYWTLIVLGILIFLSIFSNWIPIPSKSMG